MKQGKATIWLGGVLCLLLATGMVRLLLLRFAAGDIYPPYSSLRADPLGAKAFCESLEKCGISVKRNYLPPDRLAPASDSAILFLGRSSHMWAGALLLEPDEGTPLREFARKGGRVVIALMPQTEIPRSSGFRTNLLGQAETDADEDAGPDTVPPKDRAEKKEPPSNEKSPTAREGKKEKLFPPKPVAKKPSEDDKAKKAMREAFRKWLGVKTEAVELSGNDVAVLSTNAPTGLPPSIPCHTVVCFSGLDPAWKTIYQRRNRPVVVERKLGTGTIVLSALTYFTSNEALRDDRRPSLLLWLTGGKTTVIFDEFHHGISAEPNVASLIRQYRLHWFIAGLLFLAILYIWQNSTSLVPAHAETPPGDDARYSEGKDSLSGLVNLLDRNISTSSVLSECLRKWKHNLGPSGRKAAASKIARAEAVAVSKGAEAPVDAYNEISRIVLAKDEKS